MKIYIIALALFFPFFALAQGFDQDLFYGVRESNDVIELQEFLADKGFYAGPITGNFFSLTLAAVKQFQTSQNITPTSGYFGPKSRAKANELLTASGVSKTEIITEDGVVAPPPPVIPKTTTDVVNSLVEQIKLLQQQLALLKEQQSTLQQQNQQLAQQTQVIQQQSQTLQQIQQNTTPVIPPPPIVTLKVSAPNQGGKVITIQPNEVVSINLNVGNPSSNNLNPGYACTKSGDWQGTVVPVDHNETGEQDISLDFSKLLTGGSKIFKLTCSNSAGDKSDFVTVNILPKNILDVSFSHPTRYFGESNPNTWEAYVSFTNKGTRDISVTEVTLDYSRNPYPYSIVAYNLPYQSSDIAIQATSTANGFMIPVSLSIAPGTTKQILLKFSDLPLLSEFKIDIVSAQSSAELTTKDIGSTIIIKQ
jgi:peptidoglycan hydrolase-like protein with peptidoglycan-binding domain